MADVCGDNRFEIIAEAKKDLIESTNIEMSQDEMAVLDNFLFRCWQMGWLRQYDKGPEQKALIVTDAQLQVIKDACELYGRIQLGQFRMFAEIVTQTGFSGYDIRVDTEEKDEQYKVLEYEKDVRTKECIEGALEGIYRQAYMFDGKPRTNESSVALDIWAVLDGRREDGFHMGTEPLVKVKELGGKQ